jgi:PAS domain S-box-containing protein
MKKYRLIAENSGDVIWILDLKTMRFRYVSPSVYNLRGFTLEEVKAQDASASLTPESLQMVRRILPERIENFHNGLTGPYIDEIAQPCKNGKIVWTETMTRFMKNEENHHLEVLGVSRDISKKKSAIESLQESEERFREIFECSPDASFIVCRNRNYIQCKSGSRQIAKKRSEGNHWKAPDQSSSPQNGRNGQRLISTTS